MNKLPEDYLAMMKDLLKDSYDSYLQSFSKERSYGLRVNTSKISVEDFLKICPCSLEKI
ncbi:MAG: SAM-dependent methyltransferase, partial [Erysipelotrichaceae bacterium]|nr:SAM-dependent methyltransferase [Erysipelotrichaceae bacterium]